MKPSSFVRIFALLIYYLGIGVLLIKPLWLDPIQNYTVHPTYSTEVPFEPVPMQIQPEGRRIIEFQIKRDLNATEIESIDLAMATYRQDLELSDMQLGVLDGSCVFSARIRILHDNENVHFTRGSCDNPVIPAGAKLELTTKISDHTKNLALWVTPTPNQFYPAQITVTHNAKESFPVGGIAHQFSSHLRNRAEMISVVWGDSLPSWTLSFLILALLFLPAIMLTSSGSALGLAVFASATSLIMMALITVIMPPLQAPDEADHYWSYAHLNGRDHIKDQILSDMNRSHYERVFCHDLQKIDAGSLATPIQAPWPSHAGLLDVADRSLSGFKAWKLYDKLVGEDKPLRVLIKVRSLNAMIMSLAIGIATFLLASTSGAISSMTLLYSLLSIPTFWFFSVHVSNHTYIILGYLGLVVLALGLLESEQKLGKLCWAAMLLIVPSIFAGRAGFVTLLIGALLLCVGMFTSKKWGQYFVHLMAWIGLSAALVYWNADAPYFANFIKLLEASTTGAELWKLLAPPAALIVLLLIRKLLSRFESKLQPNQRLYSPAIITVTVAALGILALPLIHKTSLPNIEFGYQLDQWRYVRLTIFTWLTNLGVGGDDFLTIRSLWGGFGCPDNFFSQTVIDVIKFTVITGCAVGAIYLLLAKDIVRFFRLGATIVVSIIYLGITAAAVWKIGVTVHGRYTLGVGMLVSVLGAYGLGRLLKSLDGRLVKSRVDVSLLWFALGAQFALLGLHEVILRYYA